MPDFNASPQEQNHFQWVYSLNNRAKPFIGFFAAQPHLLVLFRQFQVLSSTIMMMFTAITTSGLHIFSNLKLKRRALFIIIAISLGLGFGVAQVPQILEHLFELFRNIFSADVATGGIATLLLHIILPESKQ